MFGKKSRLWCSKCTRAIQPKPSRVSPPGTPLLVVVDVVTTEIVFSFFVSLSDRSVSTHRVEKDPGTILYRYGRTFIF